MSQRSKPYTTNQISLINLLDRFINIPMNQRKYSWERENCLRFIKDLYYTFVENKYYEKLGSIIVLKNNECFDVYDGQQRTLTSAIMLRVMGKINEKIHSDSSKYITIDEDVTTITRNQEEIKIKYCEKHELSDFIMPKISCINPHDQEAILDIYNGMVKSYIEYIENTEEYDNSEDIEQYTCKECGAVIIRKADFIRHIKTIHNYKNHKSSLLYNTYYSFYDWITFNIKDEKQLMEFYKFLKNGTDIQYYEVEDPVFVSRIFDRENNRGTDVVKYDIVKNQILSVIPDDKKYEIYEEWERIISIKNLLYKDYGNQLIQIAIQLMNHKFERVFKYEQSFQTIINSENPYEIICKLFTIVVELDEIMNKIGEDVYGRLIIKLKKHKITWEGFKWCILPIFYTIGKIDSNLIQLIVRWSYRNSGFKTRSLNNLTYSNELIRIVNSTIEYNDYDYYKQIKNTLIHHKDEKVQKEYFNDTLINTKLQTKLIKEKLMYLETCLNTHAHIVPIGDYDIEHIIPKDNIDELQNKSLINAMGNLTLYESKNTEIIKHIGNRGLGKKPYCEKRRHYKNSNSCITKMLSKKYKTFGEEDIRIRMLELCELLNEYTDY
jgi:uncharacterized protein with ParB-like and HNH nuclease domain